MGAIHPQLDTPEQDADDRHMPLVTLREDSVVRKHPRNLSCGWRRRPRYYADPLSINPFIRGVGAAQSINRVKAFCALRAVFTGTPV